MKKFNLLMLAFFAFVILVHFATASGNYNVEVVDVTPTSLVPGEQSKLTFTIENLGDEDLENVVFSWEEKSGDILPIGSSNTQIIEELDEGDDETLDFKVFTSTSVEPGLYELILSLTYNNGEELITKTSKVGMIVGGQTDFDVSVSDSSSSGIILSVANIGKNPAESVTIVIPDQTGFSVSGSSSSIIGNLDKGDYSVASFQISSQSRNSNLNVEIQYTDTLGTRQTLTKIVEIQSTSSSSFSTTGAASVTGGNNFPSQNSSSRNNNWFLIAFILSTLLIVIVIVMIIKRNKRENETE